MKESWVPDRGELVWLDFTPQKGHEQAGQRPALVVSPAAYNSKVGLMLCCPVTTQVKGYPFEVLLPGDGRIRGAILSDQVKSLDWRARAARFAAHAPTELVDEVLHKLGALLHP